MGLNRQLRPVHADQGNQLTTPALAGWKISGCSTVTSCPHSCSD